MVGHLSFDEFMDEVSAGSDSFADDPPNATLVSLQGDGFVDVVLVLTEAPTAGSTGTWRSRPSATRA